MFHGMVVIHFVVVLGPVEFLIDEGVPVADWVAIFIHDGRMRDPAAR